MQSLLRPPDRRALHPVQASRVLRDMRRAERDVSRVQGACLRHDPRFPGVSHGGHLARTSSGGDQKHTSMRAAFMCTCLACVLNCVGVLHTSMKVYLRLSVQA